MNGSDRKTAASSAIEQGRHLDQHRGRAGVDTLLALVEGDVVDREPQHPDHRDDQEVAAGGPGTPRPRAITARQSAPIRVRPSDSAPGRSPDRGAGSPRTPTPRTPACRPPPRAAARTGRASWSSRSSLGTAVEHDAVIGRACARSGQSALGRRASPSPGRRGVGAPKVWAWRSVADVGERQRGRRQVLQRVRGTPRRARGRDAQDGHRPVLRPRRLHRPRRARRRRGAALGDGRYHAELRRVLEQHGGTVESSSATP